MTHVTALRDLRLLSLVFGILLVYQIGFAGGLFTGHPHWIRR